MNEQLLQIAKDGLGIRDVYIHSSRSFVAEGVDPKYDNSFVEAPVALMHFVSNSEIVELNGDNGNAFQLFRVYTDVGIRWKFEEKETEKTFEQNTAALIEATFVAEYLMKDEIDPEALAEFALNNVSYHIWPYWREYLMSQCTRMNLPKVPLPTRQVASNRNALQQECAEEEK